MSVPALRIPIRADVSQFQNDMKSTSAIAGTAVRTITKGVIDMNAGFLATQGAAGGAALAFRGVLGVLGPVLLGISAVSGAFKLMGYATDLAKAKIEEFNDIAGKANASNVSTDFFQRFSKSGAAILSLDQITAALKRFNEASTDKLGGSEVGQRVGELTKAGNFTGNSGVAALSSSSTTEEKLRAVVALIDQAMQKGERLAALDIAGKAFGAPVAAALQADSGYLDQMLKRADAMSNAKIISPEDVGRAIELKERMDAAQKVLAEKWKPIQDDLAKLGMNYHESWVNITEDLAAAVGYATALYTALNKVPDWFAKKIGGASVWQSITEATTTPESRAASEASLGISSDPNAIASVGQNAKLAAALQNHANVTRAMRQATDVQSAVRGDTSKNPTDAKADVNDAVDRAINTLQRHTEQQKADTQAIGLGDAALAKFRAQAAETAAVQANGGKETAEQAAKFKTLQQNASDAADVLAKARVAGEISVGRQTAFLTADDVAIAKQLAGIYGNDIPKALASSEAAELRFNTQLKAMSDLGQSVNRSFFVDVGQQYRDGQRGILEAEKKINDARADGHAMTDAQITKLRREAQEAANVWNVIGKAGTSALDKISDKLMSMAADNLWKAAFGGSGGGIGSLFGFGGSAGGTAGTMNVGGQSYVAFGAHSGMGPGDAPTFTRAVPASTFHGAPRFHSGIGPGEQAAIIRKDESVLTPGQMKQLGPAGGSAVHVNYAPVYQLTGTAEEIQKIKQAAADDRAQFASNVVATIKRAQAGRHL